MSCKLQFQIHYYTKTGENLYLKICGRINEEVKYLPLNYLGNGFWGNSFDFLEENLDFQYSYVVKDNLLHNKKDEGVLLRSFLRSDVSSDFFVIRDFWMDKGRAENAFFTDAFAGLVLPQTSQFPETLNEKGFIQMTFHIKVPFCYEGAQLLVLGNHEKLGHWQPVNGLKLSNKLDNNEWVGTVSFSIYPQNLEYKYVWLHPDNNVTFEGGENRHLRDLKPIHSRVNILLNDIHFNYTTPYWKGAGVAIPVFSLRSNQSLGVGEFNDLILFSDWAAQSGLKMIQILPINDTQSSKTWTDSYPYAAISVFALHPLYLHIESISGWANIVTPLELDNIRRDLNELDAVDYERVLTCKLDLAKKIFTDQWDQLKDDLDYIKFFKENENWLSSYALFSFFRDTYKTVDFTKWGNYAVFNPTFLKDFIHPANDHFLDIAFYFFLQYNLDKQLLNASKYAKSKGVILKGDLPIGIFKHSTDAWIYPHLFNMDGQAGAPPDPFSATGQNWGFPTYNWSEMAKDGYAWWKNRMIILAKYFSAYRIDHILGFFRIWEIPANQVDGLLGVFNPAIPLFVQDFNNYGISFDENRFCKPYLTFELLKSLFSKEIDEILLVFFDVEENGLYSFKSHLACQKDLEEFLNSTTGRKYVAHKNILFGLVCDVLFIKDKYQENAFHPRINLMDTYSFAFLNDHAQYNIRRLHDYYFYQMQDEFWREKAMEKLPAIKEATNMLICGEDLGMVPACVSGVMKELGLLTLEIQRMSKNPSTPYLQERDIPFLSVVSPSTHDMSPIRCWWDETERDQIQYFYQSQLGGENEAPSTCTPELVEKVIDLHLSWPSLWAVFPLQDLLGMDDLLRNPNPAMERINVPANPKNYWHYRMHLKMEDLLKRTDFSEKLKKKISFFREL